LDLVRLEEPLGKQGEQLSAQHPSPLGVQKAVHHGEAVRLELRHVRGTQRREAPQLRELRGCSQ
jgi:hypothetical protein